MVKKNIPGGIIGSRLDLKPRLLVDVTTYLAAPTRFRYGAVKYLGTLADTFFAGAHTREELPFPYLDGEIFALDADYCVIDRQVLGTPDWDPIRTSRYAAAGRLYWDGYSSFVLPARIRNAQDSYSEEEFAMWRARRKR